MFLDDCITHHKNVMHKNITPFHTEAKNKYIILPRLSIIMLNVSFQVILRFNKIKMPCNILG